jgi:hypothetical protein
LEWGTRKWTYYYLYVIPVHYGRAPERLAARSRVFETNYAQHPERFVGGRSHPASLPTAVWINKPQQPEKEPCMPPLHTKLHESQSR